MKTTKKLTLEAITFAIDSIAEDVRETRNIEENCIRAEAIKVLAEAYAIVSGKKMKGINK